MEEEEEQTLLDNESSQKMEILRLEQSKKTLNSLNMDLEKDLQRIDEANQSLLLKIQKEEDENNRLENELARLAHLAEEQERKELECTLTDKEQDLKELEQETSKLEKINEALTQGIAALQNQLSGKTHAPKVLVPEEENLSESPEVAKMKIQQAEVSLAEQEKELAKVLDEYESVQRLCEAQAYCIKKYQEALRKMEEEVENRFLEREVSKVLSISSQTARRGLMLVDDIQNDAEKITVGRKRNLFWYKTLGYLFFTILLFTRLQGYLLFHINHVNPDLILDTLPKMLGRSTLYKLRCFLLPFFTLEAEDVLPH
ncbi:transmembrane and coiled-coil domain-containing protein 5A isoform X1 [Antechinus flavipes]|uniref:transmembrane and coiled-coil domain-containing protein 5A isoform X1 n=1 Tax=Antechinus flavipes TaxID=38775 RepID=UPI002236616F|nr:transmembrane and coiled-coil domain-containing protein 5A isoform X1 [Antechinus flavipes]XP_051833009.1 transmembrane and coiled-coil domain-containing protein 5A isoform X1 [Antechinus flavipes]